MRPSAAVAAIALAAAGCLAGHAGTAGPARDPVALVARLDRAEPIRPGQLAGLLGVVPSCTAEDRSGRTDCDAGGFTVAGLAVRSLDYRAGQFGSLLILDLQPGHCLEAARFDARFGPGENRSDCTDGVTCIDRVYRRRWGRLSLGLGADWSNTRCVRSIVLDAAP